MGFSIRRCGVARLTLACALGAPLNAHGADVKLESLQARFYYESTGVLSENIAPPARFATHNTIIGEGDAKQPANDLLVTVVLKASAKDSNADGPLFLMIRDRKKDKTIAVRKFTGLFFKETTLVKALYVPDAACLGAVEIAAVFGGRKIVHPLELNCGE
jgi:hypothetical protein